MKPTLYYHPLSSYCHKVLIALYEMGVPFEKHLVDFGDPQARADFRQLWPTGKIPLLVDEGRPVPETSIQIEYLQQRHAPAAGLLPRDPEAALDVRLWDRLLDAYVMTPMQAIIADRLRAEPDRDRLTVESSYAMLASSYAMLDARLHGRRWLAGDAFTLADCAAAPALFYATTLLPVPEAQPQLLGYVQRLMERPSVLRTLDEALPYFRFYPGKEGLPPPYREAAMAG
jgi:glutathione S-transferase